MSVSRTRHTGPSALLYTIYVTVDISAQVIELGFYLMSKKVSQTKVLFVRNVEDIIGIW